LEADGAEKFPKGPENLDGAGSSLLQTDRPIIAIRIGIQPRARGREEQTP
jgi:hypothetical protein